VRPLRRVFPSEGDVTTREGFPANTRSRNWEWHCNAADPGSDSQGNKEYGNAYDRNGQVVQ
jgi:hypothetical protein